MKSSPSDIFRFGLDRLATVFIALLAGISVFILFVIVGYIFSQGLSVINAEFLIREPRPIGQEGGGISPAILGTLQIVFVATMFSVPLGLGVAVYLSEHKVGRFPYIVRFVLERFAGIPSIVVGVFVWALMVRNLIGNFAGIAGAVALAIIMLPLVARSAEEILLKVPAEIKASAIALGIPRWRVILSVVFPFVGKELFASITFAIARAAGETAPLLLTTLGNNFINTNMNEPMGAVTLLVFDYSTSAFPAFHKQAFGATTLLVIAISAIFVVSNLLGRRQENGK